MHLTLSLYIPGLAPSESRSRGPACRRWRYKAERRTARAAPMGYIHRYRLFSIYMYM